MKTAYREMLQTAAESLDESSDFYAISPQSETLLKQIQSLSPLFVEEIDVDFEEVFIGEVTQRGYLQ